MKKISMIPFLFLAFQMNANAGQVQVFGMDRYANLFQLPRSLCVEPRDQIRISADSVDLRGRRYYLPSYQTVWRVTYSTGYWVEWSPRYTPAFGPFRLGREADSVYLELDDGYWDWARLEVGAYGRHYATQIFIVNDLLPGGRCDYGESELYLNQGTGEPAPPQDRGFPCIDRCVVGLKCSDHCPTGAVCESHLDEGSEEYFLVQACSFRR